MGSHHTLDTQRSRHLFSPTERSAAGIRQGRPIGAAQARHGTGIIETFDALFKTSVLHSERFASHHEFRKQMRERRTVNYRWNISETAIISARAARICDSSSILSDISARATARCRGMLSLKLALLHSFGAGGGGGGRRRRLLQRRACTLPHTVLFFNTFPVGFPV
jgi:hypothetical protein